MSDHILDRIKDHIVIVDGAMGTMLQNAGLPPGESPERWMLDNRDKVKAIHIAYLEAGAEVLETNTFGGSPWKLDEYGIEEKTEEVNMLAAALAREAAEEMAAKGIFPYKRGERALVAGSIGPSGFFLKPLGELSFDEAVEKFARQARALEQGGADCLILETMADLGEIRAALIACKEATKLPVIAQMTFNPDRRTFAGTDAASAVVTLEGLQAEIIGVNCSGGPDELIPVIEEMYQISSRPLSLVANAGLPLLQFGHTVFPLGPDDFARFGRRMVQAGAAVVGGCCGTTPEHIRRLKAAVSGMEPARPKRGRPIFAVSSRTQAVLFTEENLPIVVGERMNPTSRKKLQQDVRELKFALYRQEAKQQVEAGAHMLDLNVGVPSINEAAAMEKAVEAIQGAVDVPLSIDSPNHEALERGLKMYIGKALLNSVTGEEERLQQVLPLVKRYGCAVIALTLDDKGIPMTAGERFEIARRILERGAALGIPKEQFIFDCIVLTAGAQAKEAMETPKTIRRITEELGCPTILGLSNISFGLPRRDLLNAAYWTMCISHGLSAAIINPLEPKVWEGVYTTRVLMARDADASQYISYAQSLPPEPKHGAAAATNPAAAPAAGAPVTPAPLSPGMAEAERIAAQLPTGIPPKGTGRWKPKQKEQPKDIAGRLHMAIIDGDKDNMVALVEQALAEGHEAMDILNKILIPALEELGDGFGAGRVFLPQLMLAAEAMKRAFGRLKVELAKVETQHQGTVVLATVEGDIHDIGKNIVGVLLENYGFKVYDLGKSVPAARILEEAQRLGAEIIGLSALMTTTMPRMREVVNAAREAGMETFIVIGGAVTTQTYADEIKADGYGKDARAAVDLCRDLMERWRKRNATATSAD